MSKFLFLILILLCSAVFVSAQQEKPFAVKFFEFEKISDNLLKGKLNEFYDKLKIEISSQGYIINYGTNKEIAKREKQIRSLINFRDDSGAQITLVRGGEKEKSKTIFWIVPTGADLPTL